MSKKDAVCVLASINVDLVVEVDSFPKPGETVMGHDFRKFFGGKGANQAVAARRVGALVHVLGKVGGDVMGREYLDNFRADGIGTDKIACVENGTTGMAVINVDAKGENTIIVIAGANEQLTPRDVEGFGEELEDAGVAVSQFEVPVPATQRFFEIAKAKGCITLFNPAPAREIPGEMEPFIDILIPNEGELGLITGLETETMEQVEAASRTLIRRGIPYVLVTLGSKGALLASAKGSIHISPVKVTAVDTTAAGDSFVGALASRLAGADRLDEKVLEESARFAARVAALTVRRRGAQASIPYLEEVEAAAK